MPAMMPKAVTVGGVLPVPHDDVGRTAISSSGSDAVINRSMTVVIKVVRMFPSIVLNRWAAQSQP